MASSSSNNTESENEWTSGQGQNTVLKFCCNSISSNVPNNLPASRLHMTYRTLQADTKLLHTLLTAHGLREVSNETADFNLLWTGLNVKPEILRNLLPHQRVNHFPRSYELTRKDRLYKNIERMQYSIGLKHFDFVPLTFILPTELNDLIACHYRHRGPWIVKPIASSRGRGIFIIDSVDDIPAQENVVVAKYIENPLLVNSRKCDLRLYVLVSCYNPLLIYLYEEGLVRFATVKYDTSGEKNLWNPCMHLCNYSINKHHTDYVKSSDADADDVGHKWSLSAFLKYLKNQNQDTALLMNKIEDVIIKTILASASSIVNACNLFVPSLNNCFELYGFDILIDSDLKPWLLEVNLSPSLVCDSPLDTRLKSSMLADLLTLIGLPAADPVTRPKSLYNKRDIMTRRMHSLDENLCNEKYTSKEYSWKRGRNMANNRILQLAKEQYERRGGFLRIFPSPDTWKKYSNYLDNVTGIPSFGLSSTISTWPLITKNYNKLLNSHLFPSSTYNNEFDRLARYEKPLTTGYLQQTNNNQGENDQICNKKAGLDKEQILQHIRGGCSLSKIQMQSAFRDYLQRILKNLNGKTKLKEIDKENLCDTILHFLRKTSRSVSTMQFKMPNRHLKGNDKIAVTAKYLSDFIFAYNKEMDCEEIRDCENDINTTFVPQQLFSSFLQFASECEIEDVMNLNWKLHNPEVEMMKSQNSSKLSMLGYLSGNNVKTSNILF